MSFKKFAKLKTNPFRMTPTANSKDILWAGFPGLKAKIEKRIERSIKIPNASLVLNWGEYGSGKTHAANYFTRNKILENVAQKIQHNPPLSIKVVLPKDKNPVFNLFVAVIDHLNITAIRKKKQQYTNELDNHIDAISENLLIRSVLKALFVDTMVNVQILKKYLYGTITSAEFNKLNRLNILRKLNSDEDYTTILAGIFSCLTYKQEGFSSVVLWIDEFEDITLLNNTAVSKVNNLVRELLDSTPDHFLIFLNFTLSAFADLEDLGQYLSEPVISRIKARIEFKIPDHRDLKLYLNELLNHPLYRTEKVGNPFHPFTENAIDKVIDILGNVSLRRYNEAFSLLYEITDSENIEKAIDNNFVETNKNEIVGWK